jgi:DNA-binding LacI/PurR family transcriptional regulator
VNRLDNSHASPDAHPVTSGDQTSHARLPTLEDVAAAAGVSRSTASRAINGGSRVSPDAQAAVDAAVQNLRFTPNRAARALVTHRANSVALLIPEPDDRVSGDPFFGQVIQGLGQALGQTEFQLMLLMARKGQDADRTIRYLRQGHVDGAVVVSHHQVDEFEQMLLSARMPCVFVGRPWYMPDQLSYVDTDNRLGAKLATAHLIERGRRRIGTVAGPADMIAAVDRAAGWADALTAHGLPADAISHGDFTTEGGAAATRALLDRHPDLDAIFVANDLMAVGALAVLRAAGRAVPADVALVGYDNGAVALVTDPPLTTVVNPVVQMARAAGGVLLERILQDEPLGPPTIFPPELIVRASS